MAKAKKPIAKPKGKMPAKMVAMMKKEKKEGKC